MAKEIKINLVLDDKQISAKIVNADKLVNTLRKSATKTSDVFAKWSVIATGINSAMQIGRRALNIFDSVIDAHKAQEQAERKIEQGVRSTGMAAGFTADQLKKMAVGLQEITTFGDEEILKGVTSQFLTFTNISGEQFKRVQVAALNLATVLDSDLKSASIQLGKALNDPVANLSALSRSGIQFSDDQKAVIKSLAKTNRLAEAQTIILDELEKQYGGQAEAVADTWTGAIEQSQNRIGDAAERLGAVAVRVYAPIVEGVADVALGLAEWISPMDKASDKLREQQVEFNALTNLLMDHNIEGETRNQIVETLNKKYSSYLTNLDLEKASIEDIVEAQKEFNTEFEKKIKLQAAEEVYAESIKEITTLEKDLFEARLNFKKAVEEGAEDDIVSYVPYTTIKDVANIVINDITNKLGEAKQKFKDFNEFIQKEGLNITGTEIISPTVPPAGGPPTPTTTTGTGDLVSQIEARIQKEKEEAQFLIELDALSNELFLAEVERLNALDELQLSLFEEEKLREEEKSFNNQLAFADREELLNMEMDLEQQRADTLKKIGDAKTLDEKKQLIAQVKIVDKRIQNINAEVAAREQWAASAILAGAQAYQAQVALGVQLGNLVRDSIKRAIAEAVATQIAKVIATIPFPFNIIAAPAAGLAVSALFDAIVPSFATGVRDFTGGVARVGERGPELVHLPGGSSVFNNDESIAILESIAAGRSSVTSSTAGSSNADIVKAINNQTERLERVERIAKILPEDFEERYNDYLLKESHSG